MSQSVGPASIGLNLQVGIRLNDGSQPSDKGIEGIAGIGFLRPKGITNFSLRELVHRSTEEHLQELLLHGGKFYDAAFRIHEIPFLQCQPAIQSQSHTAPIYTEESP